MNGSFKKLDTLPPYTKSKFDGDDTLIWTGPEPVPGIGDDVHVRINQIGTCRVTSYAQQCGYLGLMVWPLNPPEWWVTQNGPTSEKKASLVFGMEITLIQM